MQQVQRVLCSADFVLRHLSQVCVPLGSLFALLFVVANVACCCCAPPHLMFLLALLLLLQCPTPCDAPFGMACFWLVQCSMHGWGAP